MPTNEKDRLGEKLRDVERGREEQYFARRDRELLEKLRSEKEEQSETTLREIAKMRCPKCGHRLQTRTLKGVHVEECPECYGVWLDKGELQVVAEQEQEGWLMRWYKGERE